MDKSIGLGQKFATSDLQALAEALAKKTYGEDVVAANPTLIEQVKATIVGKYDLHGTIMTYKMSAVIDWGALLTAIISFIIIAIVLFIIVKVVAVAAAKKAALEEKAREEYYNKHPEERPVPPEPGVPEPTEVELLKEIRDALVKK
ncbi:MAG: MscL family protein [Bacilli bacterium]|nr:MscL family protein [Bacilli bacterium]